jgi:serine/threonine protein kinase
MVEYKIFVNKQIGQGAFGSVQSVHVERQNSLTTVKEELDSSMTYALKTLAAKYTKINPQTLQQEEHIVSNSSYHSNLIRELCAIPKLEEEHMLQLFTPHIASIWFSSSFSLEGVPEQNGQQKTFILQRKFSMDCGYLFRQGALSTTDKSNFFRCVLKHLMYLHERGIAHRDLKPLNILFHSFLHLFAVTDFGHNSLLEGISKQKVHVCTRDTRAPELLLDANASNQTIRAHSVKGDIWSFGIVALCAELKRSSQPLASLNNVADDDTKALRSLVRERFQGLFQPKDTAFGPDTLPKTNNARLLLARMLNECTTVAEMQKAEQKIPFETNLENLYLIHNSLRLDPAKRLNADDMVKPLRLPIARKKPFTSDLFKAFPPQIEKPLQEQILIPTQTLLDGTTYAQLPVPPYLVSMKAEAKRLRVVKELVLLLRCIETTSKPNNLTDFLLTSIDLFDRLYSSKSVKRMKDMFYASTKKVMISSTEPNHGIELNTQQPLWNIFSAKDIDREDFEDYDLIILAVYIADQSLHYGPLTSLESLTKKVYTTSWRGFSKTFLGLKQATEEEQQTHFAMVYWQFLNVKEKFLSHFFQECLASLRFSVVEDSLLHLLRTHRVYRTPFIVTKVLKRLETKPSYLISAQDLDQFQEEFQEGDNCTLEELNWGWLGHSNPLFVKPFLVEF